MASKMSLADQNTSKEAIDALNTSFDSIKLMIEEHTPKTTIQDYGIVVYEGDIVAGQKIEAAADAEGVVNVFGDAGYGYPVYVGKLEGHTLLVEAPYNNIAICQKYKTATSRSSRSSLASIPSAYQIEDMPARAGEIG